MLYNGEKMFSKPSTTPFAAVFLGAALCLAAAAGIPAQSSRPSDESRGGSARVGAADVSAGQALYQQKCEICHYSESEAKKVGPGLKDLYPRGKFANGKKVNDSSVALWIENGGEDMPGYKDTLKAEQVRALVAYLKTI
jgi:mono/diheme cytochrome c family protein